MKKPLLHDVGDSESSGRRKASAVQPRIWTRPEKAKRERPSQHFDWAGEGEAFQGEINDRVGCYTMVKKRLGRSLEEREEISDEPI